MDDLKGRVGPARTVQKRQSAERDLRLFADHPHEQLAAGERSARDQGEGVEFRPLADLRDLAFEVEFRGVVDDDRMFQRGARGERHRRQGVPLDARPGARECLDKRGARSGAEDDLRPRIERKRALAAHDVQNLDRLVDPGALRHLDGTTAQPHRLGERDHRVAGVERCGWPLVANAAPPGKASLNSSTYRPLSSTRRAAPSFLRSANARAAASIAARSGADASGAASAIAARKSV